MGEQVQPLRRYAARIRTAASQALFKDSGSRRSTKAQSRDADADSVSLDGTQGALSSKEASQEASLDGNQGADVRQLYPPSFPIYPRIFFYM